MVVILIAVLAAVSYFIMKFGGKAKESIEKTTGSLASSTPAKTVMSTIKAAGNKVKSAVSSATGSKA